MEDTLLKSALKVRICRDKDPVQPRQQCKIKSAHIQKKKSDAIDRPWISTWRPHAISVFTTTCLCFWSQSYTMSAFFFFCQMTITRDAQIRTPSPPGYCSVSPQTRAAIEEGCVVICSGVKSCKTHSACQLQNLGSKRRGGGGRNRACDGNKGHEEKVAHKTSSPVRAQWRDEWLAAQTMLV